MNSKSFKVKNVGCNCIDTIEKNLRDIFGIEDIRINLTTEELFLVYDDKKISLDEIKKNIEVMC